MPFPFPTSSSDFIHCIRQPRTIQGVHEIEPRNMSDFVALQMPDQMPSDWSTHRVHFRECLLNAVFADVPEPRFPRRDYRVGAVSLRHGDHRDVLSVPPSPHRGIDALLDLPQSIRQVRKRHNAPSYRRLHIEASESTWAAVRLAASAKRGHERRPIA
jgi:hypothetical protein